MMGQHLERLRYAAAHLGDLDHAQVHRPEDLRLAGHGLLERRPAPDGELHPPQHRSERRAAKLPLEPAERPSKIHPGIEIVPELPRELRELTRAHPAKQNALIPPGPFLGFFKRHDVGVSSPAGFGGTLRLDASLATRRDLADWIGPKRRVFRLLPASVARVPARGRMVRTEAAAAFDPAAAGLRHRGSSYSFLVEAKCRDGKVSCQDKLEQAIHAPPIVAIQGAAVKRRDLTFVRCASAECSSFGDAG